MGFPICCFFKRPVLDDFCLPPLASFWETVALRHLEALGLVQLSCLGFLQKLQGLKRTPSESSLERMPFGYLWISSVTVDHLWIICGSFVGNSDVSR